MTPTRGLRTRPVPPRIKAQNPDLAGIGAAEAFADLDRGGLAGAVRAEKGENLAAPHGQRQPVDRASAPVALDEPPDLDRGVTHATSLGKATDSEVRGRRGRAAPR